MSENPTRILHQTDVEAVLEAKLVELGITPGGSSGGGPLWVMRFFKSLADMNLTPEVPWAAGEILWPLTWTGDLPAYPDPQEFSENRIAVSEAGLYSGVAQVATQFTSGDPGALSALFEFTSLNDEVATDHGINGWQWTAVLPFGPQPVEAPPYQSFYALVEWANAVAGGGGMSVYITRWA